MKINAQVIQKLRRDRSWSQEELALAAGLNLRTIQRIEREATASLQSKKALASALDIEVQQLNIEEPEMSNANIDDKQLKPCRECNSSNLYRYQSFIDSQGAYGPDLLPKLAPGMFSTAKFLPVICADCGFIRFYASDEALEQLATSKHWQKV